MVRLLSTASFKNDTNVIMWAVMAGVYKAQWMLWVEFLRCKVLWLLLWLGKRVFKKLGLEENHICLESGLWILWKGMICESSLPQASRCFWEDPESEEEWEGHRSQRPDNLVFQTSSEMSKARRSGDPESVPRNWVLQVISFLSSNVYSKNVTSFLLWSSFLPDFTEKVFGSFHTWWLITHFVS